MSPRPYRTIWRTADPEQLQAMSMADGRPDDPYLPYEEEQALIDEWQKTRTPPPATLLSRWAAHPDERVRAELVRSRKTRLWITAGNHSKRAAAWREWTKAFLDRMVADMHADRTYWTPLLDEVICADWFVRKPVVWDTVKVLSPWLQAQATQDDVRDLLHAFRGYDIREAVLRYAGCMDREFAREIHEQAPDTRLLKALAENPSLSADVVAALATWFAEDWEARIRNASINYNPRACLVALLLQHPSTVPPDVIQRVYTLPQLARNLSVRTVSRDEYLNWVANRRDLTTSEVALYELTLFSFDIVDAELPVPPDVLCATVPFVRQYPNRLLALIRHQNADIAVWRAVIRHARTGEIDECAARNPKLRQYPEVREHLFRSGNPEAIAPLAADTDPRIAADAVRRLIDFGYLEHAVTALTRRAPETPIALRPEDLAPLFRSDDPNIRLAALTSLNRLQIQTQTKAQNSKSSRSIKAQSRRATC